MLAAGSIAIVFAGLAIFFFVVCADVFSKTSLRIIGYALMGASTLELILLVWVIVYILGSDWTLWTLSFNDFWREQLTAIYFIKEWLYSWLWRDLLDFFMVFLPAVVLLTARTIVTTFIGLWALSLAKQ